MTPDEIDQLIRTRELAPVPPERLKRIESAVIADLKPVRPLASPGVYFAASSLIFVAVLIIGCYLAGQSGWRALSEIQRVAIFAPLAASTALLIFSMVRQMTPAATYGRFSAIASAAVFVLLLMTVGILLRPQHESAFVRSGLACFRTGMTFAIPAAFLFAWVLLRGAILSPVITGATAGGVAGLVGLAGLEIHCPNLNVYHVVAWHFSVTAVCVLAGVIISGVTFSRWSSNH